MKRLQRYIISLGIGLLVLGGMGCGSVVPISDVADAVFVPDLVGQWRGVTPEDEEGRMLVLRFNDSAYYVELREEGTEAFDEDVLRLRAYITDIDGKPFVNVQNIDALDDDERLYLFYTYALSPEGLLTVTELQDVAGRDLDKFETSEALYAFIRQHMNDDALYGDAMTFRRVTSPGS